MSEEQEKVKLIKDALVIIDKLGKLDINDKEDFEIIEDLIKKCNIIKKNKLWKLT